MGAATGDYDNDGWIDLYVTYLGSNRMLRNNGNGTFTDVTSKTRTDDARWSTGATFFDYDRDGWLDLYVVNYVNFSAQMTRACFSAGSARDYCNPVVYDPAPDTLFHNNRDGTFTDVSTRTGIRRSDGRGLGVLAIDVNLDGWTDLYVANDGDPNALLINDRGQTFADNGLLAGVAVGRSGMAQGSMGIDAADADGDGDDDLFVTNLDNESNTFYRNVGRGLFEDRTVEVGLFKLGVTGFGTRFVDIDHDGWMDLIVVNGAVRHLARQLQQGERFPLKQPKLLFVRAARCQPRSVDGRPRQRRRQRFRGVQQQLACPRPAECHRRRTALGRCSCGHRRPRRRADAVGAGAPRSAALASGADGRQLQRRQRSTRDLRARQRCHATNDTGALARRQAGIVQ
jgi:hypothetical protein